MNSSEIKYMLRHVFDYDVGEACLPRIFCRLLNKCKSQFDYLYNIYMNP